MQAGYTPESLAEAMSTMPQGKNEEDDLENDQISNFKKRSDIKKDRKKNKHESKKDWIEKKKERSKMRHLKKFIKRMEVKLRREFCSFI